MNILSITLTLNLYGFTASKSTPKVFSMIGWREKYRGERRE